MDICTILERARPYFPLKRDIAGFAEFLKEEPGRVAFIGQLEEEHLKFWSEFMPASVKHIPSCRA